MKTISVLVVCILAAVMPARAGELPVKSSRSMEIAEMNLIAGVSSENDGLISSSAYYLGELKSGKAVIPLMKVLHTEKNANVRIMAALSLIKIGDARGVYAVKQSAVFDESEQVRNACRRFFASREKTK